MTYENDKSPDLYERIELDDPPWSEPGKDVGLGPLEMVDEPFPRPLEADRDPWATTEGLFGQEGPG